MSMTENELADKLAENDATVIGADWRVIARRAAELLGVTLADGPLASGFYRHKDGQVVRLRDDSTPYNIEAHVESDWALRNRDALTPARIISEEEHTKLLAEVASLYQSLDDAQERRADVEAERDELIARVKRLVSIRADEEANPADDQYAPTKPPVLTEDEVGREFDAMNERDGFIARWSNYTDEARSQYTRIWNAALAKHGGARELPDSLQVCKAIDSGFSLAEQTDAVMALLGGGGDE